MKRLLTTATALMIVGGVSAAMADVSISGNVRFHYESWSDNAVDTANSGNNNTKMSSTTDIWVKGTHTADSGIAYSGEVRMHQEKADRVYVSMSDDWGKLNLGQDWAPMYSKSLGADWRGTITNSTAPAPTHGRVLESSYMTTSGKDSKIAYTTPDLGGFSGALSLSDGGAESKATSTEFIAQYAMPVMGGNLTLSYGAANQAAKDDAPASTKTANSEMGAALQTGKWLVSIVQVTSKKTPNKTMTSAADAVAGEFTFADGTKGDNASAGAPVSFAPGTAAVAEATNLVEKQSGQELEVAYDVSDNLKLNLVVFNAKVEEGANKDDKYSSNEIGVKYTVAPGLYISLAQTSFKYTDNTNASQTAGKGNNKGNGMKLRVNVDL